MTSSCQLTPGEGSRVCRRVAARGKSFPFPEVAMNDAILAIDLRKINRAFYRSDSASSWTLLRTN
jgi:hypothetical protein